MSFVAELKRRNVFRMAGLYVVGAWLLIQIAETLLPIFLLAMAVLTPVMIRYRRARRADAAAAAAPSTPETPDLES